MAQFRGLIVLQLLSFWPVWKWYAMRLTDGSDEPWGILALLAAVFIGYIRRRSHWVSPGSVLLSTSVVALYALFYEALPYLGRGLLCVLAVALLLSPALTGRRLQPGMTGLLILSLPLIASLQFYGGFPIRFLTAHLSALILGLFGYQVEAQGTMMHWFGEVIAVDAPCAGIKMLWSGLLVNFSLVAWFNLNFIPAWIATSFTMASVFAGNVIRATALFFVESGIVESPGWFHQAIGVTVFSFVMLIILLVHFRLNGGGRSCAF